MQQKFDFNRIIGENDTPFVRAVEYTGIQQCRNLAVNGLDITPGTAGASRIDTGPAPQRTLSNSQRFVVNTCQSSSGYAKLMRADWLKTCPFFIVFVLPKWHRMFMI
ncbi:MAG: hypothetical protein LC660_02780 [Desulfobacteraceae bacterium]|nr:hypothetical protein [Desulfobacteraceae bacterium]